MPLLPHPIIRKILSELDPLTFFLSPLQLTIMMTYKTDTKLEWCHFKNRMSKKLNLLDPFYDGKLVNSLANIHTYMFPSIPLHLHATPVALIRLNSA
jgi:hypothetical protein